MTTDKTQRKQRPIARGVLDYFPDAIAEVANVSFVGNQQHNPGQEMHWAKDKSPDHADCVARHLIERGTVDTDGLRHTAKAAWRALAMLQIEIEKDRPQTAQPRDAIYIAGPMRGYPQLNFPAFHVAAAVGRALGHRIISPAERDLENGIDPNRTNFTDEEIRGFVLQDFSLIFTECRAIAVLPNWWHSIGARAEVSLATWLKLDILDATDFRPIERANKCEPSSSETSTNLSPTPGMSPSARTLEPSTR